MQHILLLEENKNVRELLAFSLATRFHVKIKEANNSIDAVNALKTSQANQQALEILEKSAGNEKALTALREQGGLFTLIIAPFSKDNTLTDYLATLDSEIPIIFTYESQKPDEKKFSSSSVLAFVAQKKALEEISIILTKITSPTGAATEEIYDEGEFCPIRTTLLIKATPLKSDIFIRLSSEKFIKIFQKGSDFGSEDVRKYYEQKKVEYLYIRKTDTQEFLNKFQQELNNLLNNPHLTQEQATQHVEAAQETIHELVNKIGFTEEVQAIAKKNVELTLKMVGQSPRLTTVLAKVQKDGNYISQHSTLLSHVCCCIAQEMEWTSDNTFTKLAIASLMHDISVNDPEIAKISTLQELQQKKQENPLLPIPKDYHLHPMKSADVVKSFQEIPADVDSIVMQHHERPNGSGFPRGLTHNYISPLSALFIIAHDMTQEILLKKQDFSILSFVESKKGFYFQGNFKKIMQKLETIKL